MELHPRQDPIQSPTDDHLRHNIHIRREHTVRFLAVCRLLETLLETLGPMFFAYIML